MNGRELIGAAGTRAFAQKALEAVSIPTGPITRIAFESTFALRLFFNVTERICRVADTESGDDGGGDEE